MKRHLKHRFLLFVIALVFIFLLLLIVYSIYSFLYRPKENKPDNTNKDNVKESTISLIMAGDALIHKTIYEDVKISDNSYNFKSIFTYIKPIVKDYGLAFYNQETILGGTSLGLGKYPLFNTPQEFGDAMIDAGFNIVSQANNHSLDRGEEGIISSINYWSNKYVLTAGTYSSFNDRKILRLKEKNGISYTLLSYTVSTNGIKVPHGKDYLVNVYDKEKAKEDIEKVRDKVDLLIVSMHWGNEYSTTPSDSQKEIASYLSSLGVDIIIGHHPHVIEPIEYINGTLVFYSLGNLVSAQIGTNKLTGMLCSLDITKKETDNKISINFSNIKANLIYTYYKNNKDFKVIPFNELNNNLLSNYKEVYNKYSLIVTSLDKDIKVVEIQ